MTFEKFAPLPGTVKQNTGSRVCRARGHASGRSLGGRPGIVAAIAAALLVFVAVQESRADEKHHYRVDFSVDPRLPACNRERTFTAILESHLWEQGLEPPYTRAVVVHVGREKRGGYAIDISLKDLQGNDVVAPEHVEYPAVVCCFEVLFNAAFIVAVHMGAFKPPAPEPPQPPPVSCPSEVKESAAAAKPQVQAKEEKSAPAPPALVVPRALRPVQVQAGIGGSFVVGTAPEALPAVQGAIAARGTAWSIELDGRWTPWLRTRPAGATIAEITTVSAALVPCARWRMLSGCGLIGVGWREASALNVAFPKEDGRVLFNLGVRASLERPLWGRFFLRLDVDLAAALLRPPLRGGAHSLTWQPDPLNIAFSAWFFASF